MRTTLTLLALALAVAAPAGAARADAHVEPAAAVRQLEPVALRAPVENAEPEQWEDRPAEGKGVRNVVNPTLTPFLPAEDTSNGLAVIVAPGGGFINLAYDNEGTRVAQFLAENGIAAFVLKYRVRPTPRGEEEYRASMMKMMSGASENPAVDASVAITTPAEAVEDGEAAVRMVRERATEWGVDPAKVGFIGFSAGAMTTLGVALSQDTASRPDFIAPIYGPRDPGPVTRDAPPMFLAIALDDPLFRPDATIGLIESWHKAGRPLEVHLYEKGGHGFGMRPRSAATELWTGQFLAWMKDRGLFLGKAERRLFEVNTMKLGAILDDPTKRAILERHAPALTQGGEMQMARGLSLRELAGFAPQVLSKESLDEILAELAVLP